MRRLGSNASARMAWPLARRFLRAYAGLVPGDTRALLDLGAVLDILGAREEAIAVLRAAIARSQAPEHAEAFAEAALRLSWLLWNDLETAAAMRLARDVLASALPGGSGRRIRAELALAVQCASVGDSTACAELIETVERSSGTFDMDGVAAFLEAKALAHPQMAQTGSAVHYMQLASELASQQHDALSTRNKLHLSGYVAQLHGSMRDARDRYIAAADFARSCNLVCEVPFEQLSAAWASFTLGEVALAAELVAAAYSTECLRGESRLKRAWVGTIVGTACGDDALASRAFAELDVEAAFRSREPSKIGPAAVAAATWLRRHGRDDEAPALLRRALRAISSIEMAWCLVAEVGRFGSDDDVALLGAMLRAYPPHHTVSTAHRALLEALCARRRGDVVATCRWAGEAELAFRACDWNYDAAACAELAGRTAEARRLYDAMGARGDAARLDGGPAKRGRPRRRGASAAASDWETACLVVSGATNKAIADQLGVSVRAVEQRLQKIYASAGAANRAELSTIVARGWTPGRPALTRTGSSRTAFARSRR
jgi:DNA-binding CsgD family transcriptional regulator/tetratricopeptide (TPR) repeat protein